MSGSRRAPAREPLRPRSLALLARTRSSAASSPARGSAAARDSGASSPASSPCPTRVVSSVPPSAAPPKISRPSGLNAQSGAAAAIFRRARSTAWARVTSCVGDLMSIRASCRTRSSSTTSSPASQRLAQASWKWLRLTKPSAIRLARTRSSSRASASSAAASGPPILSQAIKSGFDCSRIISFRSEGSRRDSAFSIY